MRSSTPFLGLVVLALTSACTSRPPVDRALVHAEKEFYCYTYLGKYRSNEYFCFTTQKSCESDRSDHESKTNECKPQPHAWCFSSTNSIGTREARCLGTEEACSGIGINNAASEGATNISRCEQF